MTLEEALTVVRAHRWGVLVTLRASGQPQTSNIVYAAQDRTIRISVTDGRAKTRNLRRDPRATLHVSDPEGSPWAALETTAHLSPLTTSPGDETGRALCRLYVDIAGAEHPDWDEFDRAMVAERRLVLTLTVVHGYGGGVD